MGLFGKKKPAPAPVAPVPAPMPSAPAWDAAKFKIQLRMARTRFEVQRTKRENSIIANRRTAAEHLRTGKDELARLFAEKTLRERAQMESYDVAMTYVELLIEGSGFIGNVRSFADVQPDLKESIATVVYAATRMSVQELHVASQMLRTHFGPATLDPVARGDDGPYLHCVNRLLAVKLDSTTPDPAVVREELIHIANEYNVQWTAPPDTYSGAQPVYNPGVNFSQQSNYPPNPPPFVPHYPGGGAFGGGGAPGGGPPGGGPPGGGFDGGGGYGGGYAAPVNPAAIPGMAPPPPMPQQPQHPIYPGAAPSAPPSAPPSDMSYGYNDNLARFNQLNRK